MIYQKIPVDISKLKNFFPEFEELYNSFNINDDEPLIYNADTTLDIDKADEDAFETRYILLMEKYNIPELNHPDIFYINQRIIHDLNRLQSFDELDPQTQNALDFLINYQQLVEEVNLKREQNKRGYTLEDEDPIIIQVKDKTSNGAIPLIYDGSGRLIVKMIYNAFKTSFQNPSLKHILKAHPEIPPVSILQSLKTSHAERRKAIEQEMLSKIAVILSDYFELHIPKSVHSRKKNLIIYELFYLFDTLKYAGKVMNIDSSNLKRVNFKTDYALPLDNSKHSPFIKELIKNNNRRDKSLSGAFLTFTYS